MAMPASPPTPPQPPPVASAGAGASVAAPTHSIPRLPKAQLTERAKTTLLSAMLPEGSPKFKAVREFFHTACAGDAYISYGEDDSSVVHRMRSARFEATIQKLGVPESHSGAYFRAFDLDDTGTIVEEEFMLGVAAMDPQTPHSPPLRDIRLFYVFRFYDILNDGSIGGDGFQAMTRHIMKASGSNPTPEEVMAEAVRRSAGLKSTQNDRLTLPDFVFNVSELRLRGTSMLFRAKAEAYNALFGGVHASPSTPPPPAAAPSPRSLSETGYGSAHLTGGDLSDFVTVVPASYTGTAIKGPLDHFLDTVSPTATVLPVKKERRMSPEMEVVISNATIMLQFLRNPDGVADSCHFSDVVPRTSAPGAATRMLVVPPSQVDGFFKALMLMARMLEDIAAREARLVQVPSPVYILGDIHGNCEDLFWYADRLWPMKPQSTAGRFLFLGDYVDRGMNSVEVIAYLFALKLLSPSKVILLRGNHETREVNVSSGFKDQCTSLFGEERGHQAWDAVNNVFDRLPIAALIDGKFFCAHGGIPRSVVPTTGDACCTTMNCLACFQQLPVPLTLNPEREKEAHIKFAMQCMWADPADLAQEALLDDDGFLDRYQVCRDHAGVTAAAAAANPHQRQFMNGKVVVPKPMAPPRYMWYGNKALDRFCATHGISRVVRGHTMTAKGVGLSKEHRVITVFSDSKDHAVKGCVGWLLVEDQDGTGSTVNFHVRGT